MPTPVGHTNHSSRASHTSRVLADLDRLGEPFLFIEERQLSVLPNATHRFSNTLPKILIILEGSLLCTIDDRPPSLCEPDTVLVCLTGCLQTYHAPVPGREGGFRALRLTLLPEPVASALADPPPEDDYLGFCLRRLPPTGVVKAPGGPEWPQWIGAIRQHLVEGGMHSRHRIQSVARRVLLELALSHAGQKEPALHLADRIDAYLDHHLGESVCLDDLARALDRSPEHLSRQYRQHRGQTILDALRKRRIARARYYLLCTEWPVQRIAKTCGFSTPALFSRTFREVTHTSPKSFRAASPP